MSGKAATSELLMRALYLSGVNKESFGQSLTDSLDLALEEVEHAMLDPRVPDACAKGLKPKPQTLKPTISFRTSTLALGSQSSMFMSRFSLKPPTPSPLLRTHKTRRAPN